MNQRQTTSLSEPLADDQPKFVIRDMNFFYGTVQALTKVNMSISANRVTAFIGPSGCGKSTLLRCMNRLNDLVDGTRIEGEILLEGDDIYAPDVDVTDLRTRVGMVFQKVNPFPKSIWQNVAYGPQLQKMKQRAMLDDVVEIPVWGMPYSYNVATATAMALYEYCRQYPAGGSMPSA